MTPLEAIKRNAQLVVEQSGAISGLPNFGYNSESVEWVEGFIERLRSNGDMSPEKTHRLVQVYGSYLGECIIHCYGGEWRESEGTFGVFFDDDNAAFPFAKVEKQFNNGAEVGDSISSFYRCIPLLFKREERTRPWWKFW